MGRRYWGLLVVGMLAVLAFQPPAAGQETREAGKIDSVTLYRDQALVVRSVRADVPAGVSELVVEELPPQVVPDSLFASAQVGTRIRAVRLRTRAVKEEPREEIRQLDQDIEKLQTDLRRNEAMRKLVDQRRRYLDKLEQFVAPTAQVELTKGVLDAKTLESLTRFIFDQRKGLTDELLELEGEQKELSQQISLLQRKRSKLTAGTTRTVREAVVFVERAEAGKAELHLSYLVKRAGWEPTYNLRAGKDQKSVAVEYNATVYQMSGEDWKDVELTLSTASPALVAKGPELAPFWVTLAQVPQVRVAGTALRQQVKRYQKELFASNIYQQRVTAKPEQDEANWRMNEAASGLQLNTELLAPQPTRGRLRLREPGVTEGLSVTYLLTGRISLESRSDRQMVQIASLKLKSDFYYVATPLLTSYVYREAEIANDSELALLEGPATCYLDGRFVGQSQVPLVARGQRFRSGFGMNSQLRAARELVERTDDIVGGNRQQTFDYRLTLENFSQDAVQLRVYDRLPEAMEAADIRVTLGEMSDKLSQDPFYLERDHPRGILRWDVKVPAKAAGPEARKVDYKYSLEFDRKLTVVTPTEAGKSREVKEKYDSWSAPRGFAY